MYKGKGKCDPYLGKKQQKLSEYSQIFVFRIEILQKISM